MCSFRYIPNAKAWPDDVTALEARLAETLTPNRVHVEAVDYISSERSGKFQPCLSHISAEGV